MEARNCLMWDTWISLRYARIYMIINYLHIEPMLRQYHFNVYKGIIYIFNFSKTNPHQHRKNMQQHIIPLKWNSRDKIKEPHHQVKGLGKIFHTPLEPNPSSSINSALFSGHSSYRHRYAWYDYLVYDKETKPGFCESVNSTVPLNQERGPHRHHKIVKR